MIHPQSAIAAIAAIAATLGMLKQNFDFFLSVNTTGGFFWGLRAPVTELAAIAAITASQSDPFILISFLRQVR
jgi:hypothetical protein